MATKRTPIPLTLDEWPEAVTGLPLAERRFVLAWVHGDGNATGAAKQAGLGTADSSRASLCQQAYRLLHRERVKRAIAEYSKTFLRDLAPKAVRTIVEIMDDKGNKDRLKAATQVLDRIDPRVQTVDVQHTVKFDPQQETLRYLRHLLSINAPREMLVAEFGEHGLSYYQGLLAKEDKAIDAEFVEVPNAAAIEDQSIV